MNWVILTFVLMLSAFAVSIILYLISKFIKFPKLESWAKGEMMEVFATAAIVGIIIGLLGMLNVIGCGIFLMSEEPTYDFNTLESTCTAHGLNPSNTAVIMLYDNVLNTQRKWYTITWQFNYWLNLAASLNIDIPGGIKINFIKYLAYFIAPFEFSSKLFGDLIFYTFFSIEMIKFFDYLSVFILPVGIILRAFPGSRGMGAMLIAVGIGFAYVYPITLIYLQYTIGSEVTERSEALADELMKNQMLEMSYYDYMCYDNVEDVIAMKELIESFIDSGVVDEVRGMVESMLNSVIVLFFIQLIALLVAITITRSLAMLLGADLAEIGRGLFRFI